jgi:hypothetical protein
MSSIYSDATVIQLRLKRPLSHPAAEADLSIP